MSWNQEYYGSAEQDFWEGPQCEVCGGPPVWLGQLGKLEHWSCRNCGNQWSTEHWDQIEARGQEQNA